MKQKTMKAAVYAGKGRLEIREVPIPGIFREEALIKVKYAGICGTDLHILAGKHPRAKPPLIMGHEFSGKIMEINSAEKDFKKGDRVVVEPLISCGKCYTCRSGKNYVCENLGFYGIDKNGAFAEYVAVAAHRIFKLPSDIRFDTGALVEPVAVAVHALRISNVKTGDTVCVIGAGPIGLITALVAGLSGASRVLVCEKEPSRIRLAEKFGLIAVDVSKKDPAAAVFDFTSGRGADLIVEAAGYPASVLSSPGLCRVGGEIVFVAMPKQPLPVDILTTTFRELTLKGVRGYAPFDFERAIRIISSSGLDFGKLISEKFPLRDAAAGFKNPAG